MAPREATIVIRRPLRTVFPFVADAENLHRSRSDVIAVNRTSGAPTAAGATYRQVVRIAWRELDLTLENTEHEPGRRLAFTARGSDRVTVRTEFSFRVIETEHTLVSVAIDGDARLLSPLARQLRKRELEALRGLKRTLEAHPPDPHEPGAAYPPDP
ncbi:MAG: SRPBCC family protein [Thermoleophilaceae bacterium]